MIDPRFFLAQDDDCHWYLVPVEFRGEWDAWRNLPTYDDRVWEPPLFARSINGPHTLTFTNPQDDS